MPDTTTEDTAKRYRKLRRFDDPDELESSGSSSDYDSSESYADTGSSGDDGIKKPMTMTRMMMDDMPSRKWRYPDKPSHNYTLINFYHHGLESRYYSLVVKYQPSSKDNIHKRFWPLNSPLWPLSTKGGYCHLAEISTA